MKIIRGTYIAQWIEIAALGGFMLLCVPLKSFDYSGAFNKYGSVVSASRKEVKGAVVDHIIIRSRQSPTSRQVIERKGILVRYPNAVATILICHGFLCDKYDVAFLRDLFPRGKYNIMTFDFRAHGEQKEGQHCTLGLDESYDVYAAARFLQNYKLLRNVPLLVYGFSMGAVASIMAESMAAQKDKTPLFKGMILDCPFDSVENVIKRGLECVRIPFFGYQLQVPGCSLLQRYAFHPYIQSFIVFVLKSIAKLDPQRIPLCVRPIYTSEAITEITTPCFFIHCKNDEKVPVEAAYRLVRNAGGYTELWVTGGRRHFDSFFYCPEKYKKKVGQFIDRVIHNRLSITESGKIKEDYDELREVQGDLR